MKDQSAGYQFEPDTINDPVPVYDALHDFIQMWRSMDREAALQFGDLIESGQLNKFGGIGTDITRLLLRYGVAKRMSEIVAT